MAVAVEFTQIACAYNFASCARRCYFRARLEIDSLSPFPLSLSLSCSLVGDFSENLNPHITHAIWYGRWIFIYQERSKPCLVPQISAQFITVINSPLCGVCAHMCVCVNRLSPARTHTHAADLINRPANCHVIISHENGPDDNCAVRGSLRMQMATFSFI